MPLRRLAEPVSADMIGHNLVRDALINAARELGEQLDVAEAERLNLIVTRKACPAHRPLSQRFNQIAEAAISTADATPVGKNEDAAQILPNPNVMIELGCMRRALDDECSILVANGRCFTDVTTLLFG